VSAICSPNSYYCYAGVVIVSWYPLGMSDSQGDSPDLVLPMLLDSAQRHNLRVAPHIEPYRDRNPINLSQYLRYIISHYGGHPAFYRLQRGDRSLPVFYIYDSYLTPAGAWKELLSAKGNLSVRGTQLDGIFLGLLVDMQHRYDIKKSHFDGEYLILCRLCEILQSDQCLEQTVVFMTAPVDNQVLKS
jgi:glycoprotein endo-alpha-1,2-mannosidase